MSVRVYVEGVRDLDKKFDLMFDLKEKCNEADASYPDELTEYFNNSPLSDYEWGTMERDEMSNYMREINLNYHLHITTGDVEYGDGLSFDLSDLPDDIKSIRVHME